MIKITLKDGSIKEVENGSSVLDVAKAISEGLARVAQCGIVNGNVVDLRTTLNEDCELEICTFDAQEGKDTVRHSISHVLAAAVKRLFPEAKIAIGPAIANGFYYDFDVEKAFTADDLDKIEAEMKKIIKENPSIERFELPRNEALELMRDNCAEPRDLAIIDMLASTGMRVGEMVLLNRNDIDFNERECVVFGKGSKERVVYFDARTKIHLQNYLESRTDNNPALFVTLKSPHERLKIGGVEARLRAFGKQLGINKVHPHKFRRTLATMAIDKGMPIEQLQQLLGHRKIDTTLQYAMVKQSNVKIAHRKYIG